MEGQPTLVAILALVGTIVTAIGGIVVALINRSRPTAPSDSRPAAPSPRATPVVPRSRSAGTEPKPAFMSDDYLTDLVAEAYRHERQGDETFISDGTKRTGERGTT